MAKAIDYFNPKDVRYTYTMPDGVSTITFRKLTDGDRIILQGFSSEVYITRGGDSRVKIDTGKMRSEALSRAMVAWTLKSMNTEGEAVDVPFTKDNREKLLSALDPQIVDDMYAKVVEHNSWLQDKDTKDTKKK